MTTVRASQVATRLLADLDSLDAGRWRRPITIEEREAIRFMRDLAANSALNRRPPRARKPLPQAQ
jgi:hypothetical protein